ncbi:mitochondrial antiviral-signaling protein isoform X2 [Gouania willdenowi]|uniref:mitochondrial antiviral-signaling protein isoform X2 n=1 Tax=Gouania willdenowi TaxID=441366 RepID=UPI001054AB57|nr:mitochondrial antiviral-signaling protein isoform X2 [Gouania willdenowi]
MSFIGDKLYNGYLRNNMSTIVNRVNPLQIINYLPCLTSHDRESIIVKTETRGKYDGMSCLLDCLKRREHWPEQLINAMEECEQTTIAAELRAEYNALRAPESSSPPTTVVRAHVHPVPSGSQQSVHLADAPAAPTEPSAPAPPPLEAPAEPQPRPSAVNPLPKAVPLTESTVEPPQSAPTEVPPPPSTPPLAAEPPQSAPTEVPPPLSTPPPLLAQATKTPTESTSSQEPEENSESMIYDVSIDADVIPDPRNAVPQERPVEACETKELAEPAVFQPVATTEESSPRCSTPVEEISNVTNGPPLVTATPEKLPVQETGPPLDKVLGAAELLPDTTFEPPAAENVNGVHSSSPARRETTVCAEPDTRTTVIKSSPQRDIRASVEPDPVVCVLTDDGSTVCLSKPTELVSIHPPIHPHPYSNNAAPAPSTPLLPFSGNISSLEISDCVKPACSTVSPSGVDTDQTRPCQENGVAPAHNDPDENSDESWCESLENPEVLTHVIQVSEDAPIFNLDVQTSAAHTQIFNGDVTKEAPPSSTDAADEPAVNSKTAVSYQACDSAPELQKTQDSEEKSIPVTTVARSTNTKYVLTAVGVGACALLMAWRFKN